MYKYKVAYGDSRQEKQWRNATITWDELRERLAHPLRTGETQEEYSRMNVDARWSIIDKGGFFAGELRDGVRKVSSVVSRSMLTLDVDGASPTFLEAYLMLSPYATFFYSMHSHRPETPRLRLIVPLTRDITPDEYQAVSRFFAAEQGINQFNPCSFIPSRLIIWPTVSLDGEFVFEEVTGEPLDPDILLDQHPDWKDPTTLPICLKETPLHERAGQKVEDPLTKTGIVLSIS